MIIETNEALARYNISAGTLYNRRSVLVEADGIILGTGGSDKNLFKTSVLDNLARSGKLGNAAKRTILNLDQAKETA